MTLLSVRNACTNPKTAKPYRVTELTSDEAIDGGSPHLLFLRVSVESVSPIFWTVFLFFLFVKNRVFTKITQFQCKFLCFVSLK